MKKVIFILLTLLLSQTVTGQIRRNRSLNQIPQTNREPTASEIAKRERQIEERKAEFLNNFLSTLEADNFQKEIIKQYLNSYFEKKLVLLKGKYAHSVEREAVIKQLDDSHFKDLEELISKSDMEKIKGLIKGEFDEDDVKKKRKKNKKRKKDKN
ncbi:hypothetical protein [uncultured Winogradskyella sp.]|uniref:hypothetical protein n=1 Tax=uncultured Winogradskyella sp. TaxID=395353 RepID=UPI0026322F7E|nr:hypothetical protein [uncultured Winogradskyella sp.]